MSLGVVKRFWQEVEIVKVDGGFGVKLDNFPLKTPRRRPIVVPVEQLAQSIAAEWRAVGEKIVKIDMPYTRLAEATIDKAEDERSAIIAKLALYGGHDLLCYRAEAPAELLARQSQEWDPLLAWIRKTKNIDFTVTNGISHVDQPESNPEKLSQIIGDFGSFRLTALYDLVTISGSIVIALAIAASQIDVQKGWQLSRIDENWQEEQWGRDDLAHQQLQFKHHSFLAAGRTMLLLT